MPVQDFLFSGENIRYRSPEPIEYQGELYDFYITDIRLILHKQKGMIFKKDKFVAETIENVKAIKYEEKGIISKKGIIEIQMGDRKLEFSGSIKAIRAIYTEMQALIK